MAARGAVSKEKVFNKLQEVFSGCFWEEEGKILRVPLEEEGQRIEIKVTLTAAKTNLGGDTVKNAFSTPSKEEISTFMAPPETDHSLEITEEEKDRVSTLLASLGL